MTKTTVEELQRVALQVRRNIVEMVWRSGSGHIGGSLSCVDMLSVLYFRVMRTDPRSPPWDGRDRFVLSKGHAGAALYAVLAERGFFAKDLLFSSFIETDGLLDEHPDMTKVPGLDMSAGSLGQGLSAAAGMAHGLRLDGSDSRVFALIGDGETQEGQIWEAAMAASHLGLTNLTVLLDYNGLQVSGAVADCMSLEPLARKWEAFGWRTRDIDGHDISEVVAALEERPEDAPRVIIARTVKGKGVSFMENDFAYHSWSFSREQYETAMNGLAGESALSGDEP